MCLQCHSKMSDQQMVEQLLSALKEPRYEQWNTTSINHMLITACGYNGLEARALSLRLLSGFLAWYRSQADRYLPSSGLEAMYSVKYLEEFERLLKQIDETKITDDVDQHQRIQFALTQLNVIEEQAKPNR